MIYSLLIIILVSIPTYFYIEIEKQSYKQTKIQELQRYVVGVEKNIYDFSNSIDNIYNFPRSFLYDSYIYDKNKKSIFSTNANSFSFVYFEHKKNLIYKKVILHTNRLNARYLIVSRDFSYKDIYTKFFIFALILGMIVFFLALFFIKMSIYPFEKANKYLNSFFNDAMHELKTPLGVMQLNLEILKKKEKTKEISRLLGSLNSITMIYEDLEYLIKYKYVDYRKEHIDFSNFLSNRVDFFNDLAENKNILITHDIADNIYFNINRVELQRIIDNTISNAIKHSNKNKKIDIKLYSNESAIIFCVKDSGYGIIDTRKIFTRYYRENEGRGDFGIGLSIVKNISLKYNINIEVESSLGEGSTFTYTFLK